jgi:hypothetical protein
VQRIYGFSEKKRIVTSTCELEFVDAICPMGSTIKGCELEFVHLHFFRCLVSLTYLIIHVILSYCGSLQAAFIAVRHGHNYFPSNFDL